MGSFTVKWLLSLFAGSELRDDLAECFWDALLLSGSARRENIRSESWSKLTLFTYRIIQRSEKELLGMDKECMMRFFRENQEELGTLYNGSPRSLNDLR